MPPAKRKGGKLAKDALVSEPIAKSSKVTMLSPSLLLLEIPPHTDTSLPVWDAVRSQWVQIGWTVNPYSISFHLTPAMTSEQGTGGTQTASASTGLLLPQMVIRSINQQNGGSQSAPQIMLTFPQSLPSPSGQHHSNPTTSVIVSLPVIITQPQLSSQNGTPTKKGLPPPDTLTPTNTPIKQQQAPSNQVSDTSLYHTKSLPDIHICDDFLLRMCRAGKMCELHHTPYPFHWQLWRVYEKQWVDINPRSQVTLERLYCDVDQETICIKDGCVNYTLNFVELDDHSKYSAVRRLANSDSPGVNPFFPSKLRVYWWNSNSWKEYSKHKSSWLLKNMSEKKPTCSFKIGGQDYKVDFTDMTQTNVTTGLQREIRCRPVYRSPDSMQLHLQHRTAIQSDSVGEPPGANFSVNPLEAFSSWYPPVWCPALEQDYILMDVPAGTQAHRKVQELFYASLFETKVDIISIQQVQNLLHWDKYQRQKAYMQKQHNTKSKEPLERHLFHGTAREASEDICHNNFDPRMAGVNGTSHGYGSYFATSASFSDRFSTMGNPDKVRHMFLAKVLVGKVCVGRGIYRRPPPLSHKTKKHCLYDACVDNMDKPTMFVVFDSCQCYPYYLIKYQELPKEIAV